MRYFSKLIICVCLYSLSLSSALSATTNNQTDDVTPVLSSAGLPFQVVIDQANFQLPIGIQSGVIGVYKGMWILIAGRINGLHGFSGNNDFPANLQNTSIYVVNPATGLVTSRSLNDASSGLSQVQIDSLTVTSPEGYQDGTTLYLCGGYGIDTASGNFETKPILTAINLPGILDWVTQPQNSALSVAANIRQIYNPIFQVTGGEMYKVGNVMQIIFGQNFTGQYSPGSNGDYTQQVRLFTINNTSTNFSVDILNSVPKIPDPNYRRRDLTILPTLLNNNNLLHYGTVAYGGVFTLSGGVWTIPVVIDENGNGNMTDASSPNAFKQAMNHYQAAAASLYSNKTTNMYHVLFGGISYGYFDSGTLVTDSQIPFINQVTTIQMDKNGNFSQYIMNNRYPTILSTQGNPGNPLLFGAGAHFIPANISKFANSVINLDNIQKPTVIGYIVGGIQSTLPNTNQNSDSSASPYVFTVTLVPNNK